MKKTVISVIGKDSVGIISKISAAAAEYNVNIIVPIIKGRMGVFSDMPIDKDSGTNTVSKANISEIKLFDFNIKITSFKKE